MRLLICRLLQPLTRSRVAATRSLDCLALPGHRCSEWCNVRGAGAGHVPTINTGLPSVVDAFYWIKTPGESDGCTRILPRTSLGVGEGIGKGIGNGVEEGGGEASTRLVSSGLTCPRFDVSCESLGSIGGRSSEPRAPEAGGWFNYQARELARHSSLRLDAPGALNSMYGLQAPPSEPPASRPRPPPIPALSLAHNESIEASIEAGTAASVGDVTLLTLPPPPPSSQQSSLTPAMQQQLTHQADPTQASSVPSSAGLVGSSQWSTAAALAAALSASILCLFAVYIFIGRVRGCGQRSQAVKAAPGLEMASRARRSRLPMKDHDEAQDVVMEEEEAARQELGDDQEQGKHELLEARGLHPTASKNQPVRKKMSKGTQVRVSDADGDGDLD